MEKIGEIIKRNNQALQSPDSTTTLQKSSESSVLPQWLPLLVQMAQDKRHDLAPGILSYWMEKLKNFTEQEITAALLSSGWEFFPSVDNVTGVIKANRQAAAEEYRALEWQQYKSNQAEAERTGLLATEDDYENLRKECREILAKAPKITADDGRKYVESRKALQVQHQADGGQDPTAGQLPSRDRDRHQEDQDLPTNAPYE